MKMLGKITVAEYGHNKDIPFLFGLELFFQLADKTCIGSGGKYLYNISKECKWSKEERESSFMKSLEHLSEILIQAKVFNVSELVGKPVEVEIEKNTFKDFRILTEVL